MHEGKNEPDGGTFKKFCSTCGSTFQIQRCAACRVAGYCSKECQKSDWSSHKKECKRLRRIKSGPGITWDELESMYPMPAFGHTLEVEVETTPVGIQTLRSFIQCKDSAGRSCLVGFYSSEHPERLVAGAVLRWQNPEFHFFMDGNVGARIEDHHLEDLCIGPF